jgi:hypothetical protein
MAHPQWNQEQIEEEVNAILVESGNPTASVNIDNMPI